LKIFKLIVRIVIILILVLALAMTSINLYMLNYASKYIISAEKASRLSEIDCIVVLGAGISNGRPSPILAERLDTGEDLFNKGVSKLLLLTGDNGSEHYNEVAAMRRYFLENENSKIKEENIYLDYAGFSTYDSMYRLREVFDAKNPVVVTQKYHLSRAIYIARNRGLNAVGVAPEDENYTGTKDQIREFIARFLIFFVVLSNKEPKYLGEKVPLTYPSPGN
jgi:vancomycin permeability regulator SanA